MYYSPSTSSMLVHSLPAALVFAGLVWTIRALRLAEARLGGHPSVLPGIVLVMADFLASGWLGSGDRRVDLLRHASVGMPIFVFVGPGLLLLQRGVGASGRRRLWGLVVGGAMLSVGGFLLLWFFPLVFEDVRRQVLQSIHS